MSFRKLGQNTSREEVYALIGLSLKGVAMVLGLASMHSVGVHQGPIKVLRVGHNQVVVPMRLQRSQPEDLPDIERAALQATGGGRVEAVSSSLWVGKPAWMCTVADGSQVFHVMVDQITLKPISKIIVKGS